jgi:hypothetical protein
MLQSLKKISWILLLAFGQQAAWAFSLAGPIANNPNPNGVAHDNGDAWQVSTIGYGLAGDIEAPKNLGEGYRWNTPALYYAEDANFLDYFGSNGVVAINQTFSILNSSLTNVDAYSTPLTEFPLNSTALNYQATALNLMDLKSVSMEAMMQELGLADPIRYVWTLHDRWLPNGAQCPAYLYLVIQRNFDISASPLNQVQYSPYINGTLYSYYIQEECPANPPDPQAWCQMFPVDPLNFNPPVAAADSAYLNTSIPSGGYYFSLTRDDVAGLRYLLTTNYISYESPDSQSLLLSSTVSGGTSYGPPFVLYTSNYTAFAQAALTNDPVTLSNLYPGLIITSSTANFAWLPTTNYVVVFINQNGAPVGSPQIPVPVPVVTYSVVTTYSNTYANVIATTNSSSGGLLYTVTVGPANGAPAGSPFVTNTAISFVAQPNVVTGDYYINTNACGTNLIVATLATNLVSTTNVIYSATNTLGQSALQYVVTTSATHIYIAEAPICGNSSGGGTTTNAPGLYQGIGTMQFTNAPFDSLLGQFFQPITNKYMMHLISNGKLINQTYQRVITTPDIVFSAGDITPGPADDLGGLYWRSNPNFDQGNALRGLAGPGTINPTVSIGFNKTPFFENLAAQYELNQIGPVFAWGSFDGSTNDPVVYPNGTSIANLSSQVLVQITPATLPNGTKGTAYSPTGFSITGGAFTAPYTWTIPSGGLPPGLTMSSTGVISGTPTLSGTFDFTLQLTDALSRSIQWTYSLTIQ